MERTRILVVDNEEDQRRLLTIILTKFGYAVKAVSSAETALRAIASENYPLIITDLIMPEMDGTELCERIKRIRPDAKVYAISGHIELYDDSRLAQLGFDGIIHKPVSMNTLKEAIKSAVENSDGSARSPQGKARNS
jgi:CheY-like chemotaxis protein